MKKQTLLLFLLLYIILLALGNGNYRLFDWDEINFAESSREMLLTGDYARVQINFQPFWEKPPLFFWIQSLCMKLFGVNEWAARLPNVIFTLLSVFAVYNIGRKLHGERFGQLWALVFGCSLLPFFYGKSGIIDPVFNLFIFLSVFQLYQSSQQETEGLKRRFALYAGLFAGLAILTKGPVGLLLIMISAVCVWVFGNQKRLFSMSSMAMFAIACIVVSSTWFGLEIIKNGPWFLEEFVRYQIRLFSTPDAGHGQPFYYHFLVVMLACFPAAIWAFPKIFKRPTQTRHFGAWMMALFWVVMILFSMVTTKIVHYSSMCYLPLAYFAAHQLDQLFLTGRLKSFQLIWQMILMAVLGFALISIPLIDQWLKSKADGISDSFAKAQTLAQAGWNWYDGWPGLILIIAIPIIFILQKNRMVWAYLITSVFSLILTLTLLTVSVIPKVEKYTQGAYLDFLTSLQGQDVYVQTGDFKSYAQYFYFKKQGLSNLEKIHGQDKSWFLTGDIDKPVYFIYRIKNVGDVAEFKDIKKVGEKNGYVFLVRLPKTPLVSTGQE